MRRQSGRSLKLIIQLPLMQIFVVYHSLPQIPNTFYNSHLYTPFLQELFLMSEPSHICLGRLGLTWKWNTSPWMLFKSVPITRQNAKAVDGKPFWKSFWNGLL